jgi:hypothetical protein
LKHRDREVRLAAAKGAPSIGLNLLSLGSQFLELDLSESFDLIGHIIRTGSRIAA